MIILTARQAAAVDRYTIDEMGVPGMVLMETAGRACVRVLQERWPDRWRNATIYCGPGNNGGDGYVIARVLRLRGGNPRVVTLGDPGRLKGDAAASYALLQKLDTTEAGKPGLIVDALFGTGLDRPLNAEAAALVQEMNEAGLPILAVDIPSGVNGTCGALVGPVAVKADATVTMGFLKGGLVLYPGAARCGDLYVAEIGFPSSVAEREGDGVELTEPGRVACLLSPRPAQAHKGTSGRVTLVAGSRGMTGAGMLSTRAALRTGGGLVHLAIAASLQAQVAPQLWEALTDAIPDEGNGWLGESAIPALDAALADARGVGMGPGLGRREETLRVVRHLLETSTAPLVLDADGLLALPDAKRDREIVVTPHPGEMSRLLGKPIEEILGDPIGSARACAARFNVVALLKGAHTIIAAPDGRVRVNFTGNPGMASGGMGDVLTGIIATLLAEGLAPFDAAAVGAFVHGRAADLHVAAHGERGLLARDVAEALPDAIRDVQQNWARIPFPKADF
ncbi:MAG: NAD(P)H-hydrate dehydratase [Armatimonadetes bacterium]|nr:NAD(P)H-hydrate dehydratase [Armatimonadota bacterium]